MDFWGVAVGSAIASAAWIYQRTWERQERRIARYSEILDRLPAFTSGNVDPAKMNEALAEGRKLWISAPDNVVLAYEKLLDIAESKATAPEQLALGACILAMRQDAAFAAALFPPLWRTRLQPEHFRIRLAKPAADTSDQTLQSVPSPLLARVEPRTAPAG